MIFLVIMVAGLIGLLLMALPGLQQHGHAGTTPHIAPPAHAGLRLGHAPAAHGSGQALPGVRAGNAAAHTGAVVAPRSAGGVPANAAGPAQNVEAAGFEIARLIPSPRAIFSMLTLFGAFGYALFTVLHVWQLAALIALVPAWGIEYFAVRPLWNLMFQFQGKPTTPIEALVMCEAKAVTPFRNGKGLVSVEHDGRVVQFSARLQESHANVPVRVGDTLCVEEVDPANQRMVVSVR
jgi:hypothetical protein